MSRPVLAYGVCGEGLGHAARAAALIEFLGHAATIHILTHGEAFRFFQRQGYPHLHQIPGLTFAKRGQMIDWPGTMIQWSEFVTSLQANLCRLSETWELIGPDMALTDFEPLVPRMAIRRKIPVLSVDNQAKISRCTLLELPAGLQLYQAVSSVAIEWLVPRQVPRVISCFHPEFCRPVQPVRAVVGPMVRKAVSSLRSTDGGFALVYYKEVVGECLLRVAKTIGIPTVVFGGGAHVDRWPGFGFHPHGPDFPEALSRCSCLICPAGNQLLGEAGLLGKKTVCIPQKGQYEQAINAFYMEKIGLGISLQNLSAPDREVERFLAMPSPTPRPADGVERVAGMVMDMLGMKALVSCLEKDKFQVPTS